MTPIEFLQISSPLIALFGVVFRVGQFTSRIDQRILKVESGLLAKVAELRSELLLRVNDFGHKQEMDEYKFEEIKSKMNDLLRHVKDAENAMNKEFGYTRRPYVNFEDTQARRGRNDSSDPLI